MATSTIDIRIVQALCSRICHDLAGPVGAVNNGLELLQETGGGSTDETFDVIFDTARDAATELEFARMAFGSGGGTGGSFLGDAERICRSELANRRVTVVWDAEAGLEPSRNVVKLLMNMALAGQKALRGRGTLAIRLNRAAQGLAIDVVAEGPGADFDHAYREGLAGNANIVELTPIIAQACFTFALARLVDAMISIDEAAEDRVRLTAQIPDGR